MIIVSEMPKAPHGILQIGPLYLEADLHRMADAESNRGLRFTSMTALFVPNSCHTTISDKAFPVAAVRIWNRNYVTRRCALLPVRYT